VIHVYGIAKNFGKRLLFRNLDLTIQPDDRIGLVGANGTGKTTLFRLLAGEEEPDEGRIDRRRGVRVGFLHQEIRVQRGGTVLAEVIHSVADVTRLERERHELEQALHDATPEEAELLARRLSEVQELFHHLGGYELESRAREILAGLGFTEADLTRPLAEFSGGWHMRLELAKLLLQDLDLLLLDEPTNHLDLESIQWFEQFLASFRGAYVLVSHDREFLNRAIRRIVEVTPGGLRDYPGNYEKYREMREHDDEIQARRCEEQQARIREIEDFIARNRVRKDRAPQVQSRIKELERMERLEAPVSSKHIRLQFPPAVRSGGTVLELRDATMRYGALSVFEDVAFSLLRDERVCLVGRNGAGKSTLLRVLAGVQRLTGGECVVGHNVSIQYFAQHQLEALNLQNSVQREVEQAATYETNPIVRSLLGAFLFSGDDADKKIEVLSGGEKSRVALAKMLVRHANLLIMDEPTNHLDITSREVLERALLDFGGTLLFTSHDRQFIDHVATKVVEVRGGQLHHYLGNWSYYAWKKARLEEDQPRPGQDDVQRSATARDRDRDRKRREAEARNQLSRVLKPLKTEFEDLENRIQYLEIQVADLDTELSDPGTHRQGERVRQLSAERGDLMRELTAAMTRWEGLGTEIERVEREGLAVFLGED
jgi:ATP-binding cassette subfamily F protein 3